MLLYTEFPNLHIFDVNNGSFKMKAMTRGKNF